MEKTTIVIYLPYWVLQGGKTQLMDFKIGNAIAYYDEDKAKALVEKMNKSRKWYHKMAGHFATYRKITLIN